jgi:hypothetical protein
MSRPALNRRFEGWAVHVCFWFLFILDSFFWHCYALVLIKEKEMGKRTHLEAVAAVNIDAY